MKCLTTSCSALSAVVALSGCGGAGTARVARAQTAHVDWTESGDPHHLLGGRLVFHVRTLQFGRDGWSVDASLSNRTKQPVRIVYGDHRGQNAFGIRAESGGFAIQTRARPRIPAVLLPGESWSGTFAGPQRIAPGARIRVQFGQFGTEHGDRWTWVTDHSFVVR